MRRGAMKSSRNRISELPDPILGHILSLMPIKSATTTSILSSRWRHLWKHIWVSATTLDFTGDLATGQTPDQLVACVDRYLQLHTRKKIRGFRLSLHPANPYQAHLQQWVELAASKCVEELDLDFSPPPGEETYNNDAADEKNLFRIPRSLFSSGSLTHLNLSYCHLCPLDLSSLRLLKSLSLRCVNIDDSMLQGVLSNCQLLETLSLRECQRLQSIEIPRMGVRLKRLVLVDCWEVYTIKVSAPSMESFHFFGEINKDFSFEGASSLVDAFICSLDRECTEPHHDYVMLLSNLAHVRILTVCTATLMRVALCEEYHFDEEYFPLQLENLRELQILMGNMDAEHLSFIYGFFRLCPSPSLEKLFIRLPKLLEDPDLPSAREKIIEGPQSVQFDDLKAVKMSNFKGSHCEMELVKFFLGKAANLEWLVLVTPSIPVSDDDHCKWVNEYSIPESRIVRNMDLKDLYAKLLLLPKASSHVQIVISEYSEDDSSLKPTHMSLYCDAELHWMM